jgi:hypothetical protein
MNRIKFIIAWLPARVFYYLGDLVSKIDWPEDEERIWDFYQWTMNRSCNWDDWGDTKLWSEPVKD